MYTFLKFGPARVSPCRSTDEQVKAFPSPKRVHDLFLEGVLDGIQLHTCGSSSFIKLYKGGNLLHELVDLEYQEEIMLQFRMWCQSLPQREGSNIVHDTGNRPTNSSIPRKIYFTQGTKKLIYLSYGISAKYNYCECFDAAIGEQRKQITLEGKARGCIIPLMKK